MVGALKDQSVKSSIQLRIAFPEVIALAASESVAKEIAGEISIEDLDSGEIESRVLDRRIDFAFTFVPFPHKDLDHLKIVSVAISSFCWNGKVNNVEPDQIPYVIPSAKMKDKQLQPSLRSFMKRRRLATPIATNRSFLFRHSTTLRTRRRPSSKLH